MSKPRLNHNQSEVLDQTADEKAW